MRLLSDRCLVPRVLVRWRVERLSIECRPYLPEQIMYPKWFVEEIQFDSLKKRIEGDTPLSCIVVDKWAGKSAHDLWQDIRTHIEQSAACVFDLTGFRPNVVLELGYGLSIKSEEQVFITFRKRKSKGKTPTWLLSDISHLQLHDALEKHVRGSARPDSLL